MADARGFFVYGVGLGGGEGVVGEEAPFALGHGDVAGAEEL